MKNKSWQILATSSALDDWDDVVLPKTDLEIIEMDSLTTVEICHRLLNGQPCLILDPSLEVMDLLAPCLAAQLTEIVVGMSSDRWCYLASGDLSVPRILEDGCVKLLVRGASLQRSLRSTWGERVVHVPIVEAIDPQLEVQRRRFRGFCHINAQSIIILWDTRGDPGLSWQSHLQALADAMRQAPVDVRLLVVCDDEQVAEVSKRLVFKAGFGEKALFICKDAAFIENDLFSSADIELIPHDCTVRAIRRARRFDHLTFCHPAGVGSGCANFEAEHLVLEDSPVLFRKRFFELLSLVEQKETVMNSEVLSLGQILDECSLEKREQVAHDDLGGVLAEKAQKLMGSNQFCEALGVLDLASLIDPDSALVLTQLGRFSLATESMAEAVVFLGKACDLDPENIDVLQLNSHALSLSGDSEQALEMACRCLDRGGRSLTIQTLLVDLCRSISDLARRESVFEKMYKRYPDCRYITAGYGRYLIDVGDAEGGMAVLERLDSDLRVCSDPV